MIDAEVEGETPASPGVTRCWQAKFYPLLGPDGAVSAVGLTVEETTERKAAIEHQRFLLRELAHRQKNMLAVIQGMATQTARGASDTAHFLEAFTQRLQALAISLDLLLSTQWTGAQVRELIARHLQPFAPSPERLDLEGPNVWVDPDSTQAIGLALHELGTNAVKYGAWSSPNGLVGVAWKFTSAGDLELRWQESGGPPVKPPGQKGFGDVVIRKMVAHKVGGIVELDFSPEGLTWRVIIPSDHLRRAA
jgi:two-component sensor histidine kinase